MEIDYRRDKRLREQREVAKIIEDRRRRYAHLKPGEGVNNGRHVVYRSLLTRELIFLGGDTGGFSISSDNPRRNSSIDEI